MGIAIHRCLRRRHGLRHNRSPQRRGGPAPHGGGRHPPLAGGVVRILRRDVGPGNRGRGSARRRFCLVGPHRAPCDPGRTRSRRLRPGSGHRGFCRLVRIRRLASVVFGLIAVDALAPAVQGRPRLGDGTVDSPSYPMASPRPRWPLQSRRRPNSPAEWRRRSELEPLAIRTLQRSRHRSTIPEPSEE